MNKELLLFQSVRNTGKTKPILLLKDKLIEEKIAEEKPAFIKKGEKYQGQTFFLFQVTNINIGLYTHGDDIKHTERACTLFEANKCNICVGACQTRGVTVEKFDKWTKEKKYNISFFKFIGNAFKVDKDYKKADAESADVSFYRILTLLEKISIKK